MKGMKRLKLGGGGFYIFYIIEIVINKDDLYFKCLTKVSETYQLTSNFESKQKIIIWRNNKVQPTCPTPKGTLKICSNTLNLPLQYFFFHPYIKHHSNYHKKIILFKSLQVFKMYDMKTITCQKLRFLSPLNQKKSFLYDFILKMMHRLKFKECFFSMRHQNFM